MSGSRSHVELRHAYADSVALLQVSKQVAAHPAVAAAQVAMATELNLEVLARMGFEVPAEATPDAMVVALQFADDAGDADLGDALRAVDTALAAAGRRTTSAGSSTPGVAAPRTTRAALRVLPRTESPGDTVVLVSTPGAGATVEAMDALEAGCDVMIFSDNVPVEHEVALKSYAANLGLLVMGPDCGTTVLGGLGLGFANVVEPGPVGLVAASGTGAQQLMALLDHAGVGVSAAIGVGGRDLSAEVAGRATTVALSRLDADPSVERILVVSKPPSEQVAARLRSQVEGMATPVELALLGPGQPDLTTAAALLLERLGRPVPTWPVEGHARLPRRGATRLHGLFVGGTLCSEAALIVAAETGADTGPDGTHPMTDFGDDRFTRGRAHPMIDPSLRTEHLLRVAADPETAVMLLDVVLGHGADPDPATALATAITGLEVPVVVTVVGTDLDPQGRTDQVARLVDAGAEVHLSNAGATRRALELLRAPASGTPTTGKEATR